MPESASNKILKIATAFLLLVVAVNLLILDIKIFSQSSNTAVSVTAESSKTKNNTTKTEIKEKESSASANTSSAPPPPVTIQQTAATSEGVQEFYVPFGGDTTSNTSYTDLTSTDTLIDTGSYGNITQAFFIGGLSNPTQNGFVQAQIYNVTDQHPVWGSVITLTGASPQTIISNPFPLDAGPKLYRIQLMSSLGFPAVIENAKLRILAQ